MTSVSSDAAPVSGQPGGKLALCLCGGGITGAMYELGALAAIDDYFRPAYGEGVPADRRPFDSTRFDIYIGISAGSYLATALCGGISPRRLARAVLGDPFERSLIPNQRTDMFRFEPLRAAGLGLRLGAAALRSLVSVARGLMRPAELPIEVVRALPAGLFTMRPYRKYLARFLRRYGIPERLCDMPRELYIAVNDLDTGHRAILGGPRGGPGGALADVGAAEAICASSAIPVWFEPVRIRGRDYVDGGTGKAEHVDVALKRGARLVVCINPMVPFRHDPDGPEHHLALPGRPRHLGDLGLFTVSDQAMRLSIKARLHQGLRRAAAEYRDATILLLEPDEREADMFLENPMNFEARAQILRYGYHSAAAQLTARRELFDEVCGRFGLHGDIGRLKRIWP
jgi:NTE family protein